VYKRVGKPVIFFTVIIIAALTLLTYFGWVGSTGNVYIAGARDIRFGIDIVGGFDITLKPDTTAAVTTDQLNGARTKIEARLDSAHITDREIFVGKNIKIPTISVRIPIKSSGNKTNGDIQAEESDVIKELGSMALLTFEDPDGNVLLNGEDVKTAKAEPDPNGGSGYAISLAFTAAGQTKFADATTALVGKQFSIFMDKKRSNGADIKPISSPLVQQSITDGTFIIDNANTPISKTDATNLASNITKCISKGEFAQFTIQDPDGKILITANDVSKATAAADSSGKGYAVSLTLTDAGKTKFANATAKLIGKNISVYMYNEAITSPVVNEAIPDGNAIIDNTSSPMTAKETTDLANQINAGALPFGLTTDNYSYISPTLGTDALLVMLWAGLIAFILICLFMIFYYRLPGFIACIALVGHMAGTILAISWPQFTLTLPGMAGIILSIGMGVDCNIITFERIKEELRNGKTLDGAIDSGFMRSFSAIFDGNITVLIVGIILWAMGSASVKSFGYTLFWGVIFNFVMGMIASRIMLVSVSRFPAARKKWLYSGRLEQ
jgi:preprotein translocase subunit SecD